MSPFKVNRNKRSLHNILCRVRPLNGSAPRGRYVVVNAVLFNAVLLPLYYYCQYYCQCFKLRTSCLYSRRPYIYSKARQIVRRQAADATVLDTPWVSWQASRVVHCCWVSSQYCVSYGHSHPGSHCTLGSGHLRSGLAHVLWHMLHWVWTRPPVHSDSETVHNIVGVKGVFNCQNLQDMGPPECNSARQ